MHQDPTEGPLITMANMSPVLANTAVLGVRLVLVIMQTSTSIKNPWEHESILVAPLKPPFIAPTASFHIANYKFDGTGKP